MTTKYEKFRYIDLFAGIGGTHIPFSELNGECVFASEWDDAAQKSYEANYGFMPKGDITQIPADEIPDHDILLGGFPCQAFSVAGNMKGFQDTRGTLFFDVARILDEKKPAAFLLENVKQLKSHDGGKTFAVIVKTLEDLGYFVHSTVLNALDFGVPQQRQRTIIVGFRENLEFSWPEPNPVRANLADSLEADADADPRWAASEYIIEKRKARIASQGTTNIPFPAIWHENKSGNISALPYSVALRTSASHNYILVNGVRLPTSRELLNFQGFPSDFKIVVPHREIRKQAGNAVPVPMIRAVAVQMLASLRGAA